MQKIRKIYRADFRENRGRQTERQRDRDGPEYKGPPDAIAKPSDQKDVSPHIHFFFASKRLTCYFFYKHNAYKHA